MMKKRKKTKKKLKKKIKATVKKKIASQISQANIEKKTAADADQKPLITKIKKQND